jgi:hypothetical protein
MKLSYSKIVSDGNLLVLRDDAERCLNMGNHDSDETSMSNIKYRNA